MPKETNIRLMKMEYKDLKIECNNEINTMKRTQEKMKMGMKNPTTQTEKLRESPAGRTSQADDRIVVPTTKQITYRIQHK